MTPPVRQSAGPRPLSGRFDQMVSLSAEVDPSKAEATLIDGVLTVRAPRAEASKPRKVEVTVG